jgi:uroporphyrinogen decarboxylase
MAATVDAFCCCSLDEHCAERLPAGRALKEQSQGLNELVRPPVQSEISAEVQFEESAREVETHHRGTEDTEEARRLASSLCPLCALCVSVVNRSSARIQFGFEPLLESPGREKSIRLSEEKNSETERAALHNSPFMRACRREPVPYTPIWLMRQAGRYMREYREVRARVGFLELCKTPDLAAEVTVTAAERLNVDAAIIFADILLILEPMGIDLEFARGEGPVIHNPVRAASDVERLREVENVESLDYVFEAIRRTRRALRPDLPLIGFSGAPFTLASYMIEGGGSRNYVHTKSLMYGDSGAWHAMMSLIARALSRYLNAQIAAGAQVVQLFDSWVGCLSPEDYREYVLPHTRAVIRGITAGTPVIHFGTGTATLLELMREAGGDVIGLDWRVGLRDAWQRLGDVSVMGNLDPVALFANQDFIRAQARRILESAGGLSGHIFNLGHGILPETPVENVIVLVEAVHEISQRK